MKFCVIIILSVVLFSCSEHSIEGMYQRKFETLDLKPNSTYSYVYRLEWVKARSEGNWKSINENTIVINSQYDVNNLPLKVTERTEAISESIFKLIPDGLDSFLRKNIQYELILDEQSLGRQTQEEIKVQRTTNPTSFKVIIYIDTNVLPFPPRDNVSTETYKIQTSQSNAFEVHIPLNADMFYYENISNDTLKIKGNKLHWASKGAPPYKRNGN
jgi:hypothetical protein